MRLVTRIVVIVWLGLLAGDMVAQGLLVGWARHGLPLAIAPGLVALAAVALLAPPLTGRQPYCHQLCPHGAAQELLHRTPWRWTPPARLARALRAVPLLLLALVALTLVLGLRFDLASIEPFDAWMLPLCGWATVAIAVVGLGASCFVSMAYCRYGCPTGALLDFVRRRGRTDRFGPRDWFALGLLGLGLVLARLR